jgi:hypothetical protein
VGMTIASFLGLGVERIVVLGFVASGAW